MIRTEFGIIECFDEHGDYTEYAPERYQCVAIDDDRYMNDWWNSLLEMETYNVCSESILQPQKALSRWGITIIPPSSLPKLLNIVVSDERYRRDQGLMKANSLYAIKPSLSETEARVKIVAGAKEQKSIRDSAKLLQKAIPGSSMEILPGLRHGDLSINHPETYAQMLKEWIGR